MQKTPPEDFNTCICEPPPSPHYATPRATTPRKIDTNIYSHPHHPVRTTSTLPPPYKLDKPQTDSHSSPPCHTPYTYPTSNHALDTPSSHPPTPSYTFYTAASGTPGTHNSPLHIYSSSACLHISPNPPSTAGPASAPQPASRGAPSTLAQPCRLRLQPLAVRGPRWQTRGGWRQTRGPTHT